MTELPVVDTLVQLPVQHAEVEVGAADGPALAVGRHSEQVGVVGAAVHVALVVVVVLTVLLTQVYLEQNKGRFTVFI